ncbi:hypothetical protein [Halobellus sp. EA9]|uniref:hypothetical protein n=1 Tax=Halobellus sp. EA9 TaxID=3421647 RepID=UPI003EBB4F1D
MAPETVLVLLLFGLVTVPLVVGAVAFLNRDGGETERVEELERRVEELESERE